MFDEDFLVAHGFPDVTARFSPLLKALMSQSLPYDVMKRRDDLPEDMKPFQFAMDFDPKNVRLLAGTGDPWPDPRGLSGSPIWRIGAAGRSIGEWSPDDAQLVGVMTQWRPDHHLLVASTAAVIVDLVG